MEVWVGVLYEWKMGGVASHVQVKQVMVFSSKLDVKAYAVCGNFSVIHEDADSMDMRSTSKDGDFRYILFANRTAVIGA